VGSIEASEIYPLVNIQKTMERSTMLSMGKSIIFMVNFNSYVKLPEGTDPVIHIVNNIYDFIAIPSDFQLLTSCSSRICPVHRKQRSSYLAPGRAAARTFHELLGV
jgi:hypothetical protein